MIQTPTHNGTLEYVGTGYFNPPNSSGQRAKGIAINKECCPSSNRVTIDTSLCNVSIGDRIFLQELIACDGTICSGIWDTLNTNTGLMYDGCDNSITITAEEGCGTFTLEFDGTGNNPLCGAFVITVNISVGQVQAGTVGGSQEVCAGEDPDPFTVLTAASGSGTLSYQWYLSAESDSTGFMPIAGATAELYDPTAADLIADTTYFRQIASIEGCNGSMCADTSNSVVIITLADCLSLGSTVFEDSNNSGVQDSGEPGIENVLVVLYMDGGDGLTDGADDTPIITGADGILGTADDGDGPDGIPGNADDGQPGMYTDAMGNYFFSELEAGGYYVQIPMSEFGSGSSLEDIPISSNTASGFAGETDPNDNVDNDDEGLQTGGTGTVTTSNIITLATGMEPTDMDTETAQGNGQDNPVAGNVDADGNMTLDFGFFAPVSIGDTTWVDLNANGLQDPIEPFLQGVTVTVYDAVTMMPVTLDAEGNAYNSNVMTDALGFYEFTNLPPGDYYVIFDISTAPGGSFYRFTNTVVGNSTDNSDADPNTGQTLSTGGTDVWCALPRPRCRCRMCRGSRSRNGTNHLFHRSGRFNYTWRQL